MTEQPTQTIEHAHEVGRHIERDVPTGSAAPTALGLFTAYMLAVKARGRRTTTSVPLWGISPIIKSKPI